MGGSVVVTCELLGEPTDQSRSEKRQSSRVNQRALLVHPLSLLCLFQSHSEDRPDRQPGCNREQRLPQNSGREPLLSRFSGRLGKQEERSQEEGRGRSIIDSRLHEEEVSNIRRDVRFSKGTFDHGRSQDRVGRSEK